MALSARDYASLSPLSSLLSLWNRSLSLWNRSLSLALTAHFLSSSTEAAPLFHHRFPSELSLPLSPTFCILFSLQHLPANSNSAPDSISGFSTMDRKQQSFFSSLKDEVIRTLSPSRSRSSKGPAAGTQSPISGFFRRKKNQRLTIHRDQLGKLEPLMAGSRSLRWSVTGEALTPLIEGPDPDSSGDPKRVGSGLGHWVKGRLSRASSAVSSSSSSYVCKRSDLRLLLGVMGAPLAPLYVSCTDPFPHLSIKDTPIVRSPLSLLSLSLSDSEFSSDLNWLIAVM